MNKSRHPTVIGTVQDVNGTSVSVSLQGSHLSGVTLVDGQGYRIGQIGSFVKIPIGYSELYGIVSQVGASARPEGLTDEPGDSFRWLTVQLLGEGRTNGSLQRGISQYPTIDDDVHLVSQKDLETIYGRRGKQHHLVKVGHVAGAHSIDALLDINKLITRHSAIVGTTGSGKSTTVASIVRSLSSPSRYPSSRIIVLDLHGEYKRAFGDRAHVFKINASVEKGDKLLALPFWAMEFDEMVKLTFGSLDDSKHRNIIMERVLTAKINSGILMGLPEDEVELINVDTPIPFSLNKLWYDLYSVEFGTYYSSGGATPTPENWAFKTDADGVPFRGDAEQGIAPRFKEVKNVAGDDEKINYIPGSIGIRSYLEALGSKLRIGRFDFYLKPGPWSPNVDGVTTSTLDVLLKDWLGGDRPVSILDLSGVPPTITNEVVGVLLRMVYDALFWARELSQGGRERPLLLVLEEAHSYLGNHEGGLAELVVKRIVKEGRKYGIGAMIVSQRPSEIDSTILSQCGTFISLRLANGSDRSKVSSAMSDNLDGLTSMLPILRTGEAIISGEAVEIPMRTLVEPPPKDMRPDSQDPVVCDSLSPEESMVPGGWAIPMEDNPNYSEVVSLWRKKIPYLPNPSTEDA